MPPSSSRCLLVLVLVLPLGAQVPAVPPYQDATQPVEVRVRDLLARMTT